MRITPTKPLIDFKEDLKFIKEYDYDHLIDRLYIHWDLLTKCNFDCSYCHAKRQYQKLGQWNDIDIFERQLLIINALSISTLPVFLGLQGGEPFLHPKIEFIIKTFNRFEIPFVIQTNFSLFKKIKEIKEDFIIQVSIHRLMIKDIKILKEQLKELQDKIRRIDIMYDSLECISIYKDLKDLKNVYIAPIADFKTSKRTYLPKLIEFNKYKKLLKEINFEPHNRSLIWEDMFINGSKIKGKKCIYKDKYILFDPQFKSYNCSHRINCEICPNDACFIM